MEYSTLEPVRLLGNRFKEYVFRMYFFIMGFKRLIVFAFKIYNGKHSKQYHI